MTDADLRALATKWRARAASYRRSADKAEAAEDIRTWNAFDSMCADRTECADELAALLDSGREAQEDRDIDLFWQYVENGWDIESREFFEREARTNGFGSPLAMAAHHMWKRAVKEQAGTPGGSRGDASAGRSPASEPKDD